MMLLEVGQDVDEMSVNVVGSNQIETVFIATQNTVGLQAWVLAAPRNSK